MLKQQIIKTASKANILPNLAIIGAMKCGTTSLHKYLALHPQIHMSQTKELDFFIEEKNWQRGLDWYCSNFTEITEVVGESSPNYSKYPAFKGVAERMHRIIPEAKLIYIVRDPIKRIVSHYIHAVNAGYERRSFADALTNLSKNAYVDCTFYYMQIEQFLTYYPPSRILVISLEDLNCHAIKTLCKVFEFLGVDPSFEHEEFLTVFQESRHKKQLTSLGLRMATVPGISRLFRMTMPHLIEQPIEQPVLSKSLHQALVDVVHDDVEKLRAFTGCSFADWSL